MTRFQTQEPAHSPAIRLASRVDYPITLNEVNVYKADGSIAYLSPLDFPQSARFPN